MMLKDRKFFWYVRNSLWVLFSLIPCLWWLPFFRVGKKLQDKRYRIIGYVQLGIFICLAVGVMTELVGPCILLLMLQWLICFVWSLVLLKTCWARLKEMENRRQLEQKLVQRMPVPVAPVEMPRQEVPQPEVMRLNVNSCTEEELCALPGISIIEAKKMTDLRQTHGDYTTVEEFIAAIGVKPHVAVRIVDRLYAEPAAPRTAVKSSGRILDI